MKAFILICASLCLVSPLSGIGGEMLLNGDFESRFVPPGGPDFWKGNVGDGNSNLQDTTHLSPFTNVYPAGRNSVRLEDGTTNSIYPNLVQPFVDAAAFIFSFEFCVDAVNDAPWKVTIGDNPPANLDFLIDAANTFQFAGGTSGTVMTLSPGVWYQLSATVNDTAKTFSGSLTPFGSAPVSFAGLLYPDGSAKTNYLEIKDFSSNQNSTIYLDNFSLRTVVVPEPSASGFLAGGLAALFGFRRLFSSMRRRQAGVT